MHVRPFVRPHLYPQPDRADTWWHVTSPLVRTHWTAVIGPTAVADLLRLVAAAQRGIAIRAPHGLRALVTEGIVIPSPDGLYVSEHIWPPDRRPGPRYHRLLRGGVPMSTRPGRRRGAG